MDGPGRMALREFPDPEVPDDAALLDELCLADAIALRDRAIQLWCASGIAANNMPFLPHHAAKG